MESKPDELEEIRRFIAHEQAFALRSPQFAELAHTAIRSYEARAARLTRVREYA